MAVLGRRVIEKEARIRCLPHRPKVTTVSIFHSYCNWRSHIFLVKIANIVSSCLLKHLRGLNIKSSIFLFYAPRNGTKILYDIMSINVRVMKYDYQIYRSSEKEY